MSACVYTNALNSSSYPTPNLVAYLEAESGKTVRQTDGETVTLENDDRKEIRMKRLMKIRPHLSVLEKKTSSTYVQEKMRNTV